MRVEDGEIRFENRDDESTFRFEGLGADDGLWRLEERVDEQVVRVGVGDDWRTAIAHYEAAVEADGMCVQGPAQTRNRTMSPPRYRTLDGDELELPLAMDHWVVVPRGLARFDPELAWALDYEDAPSPRRRRAPRPLRRRSARPGRAME